MRVVVCWIGISGYLAACWRALAHRPNLDVKILFLPSVGTALAPFDSSLTDGIPAEPLTPEQGNDPNYVAQRVITHNPDVVVIPGWTIKGYTALPFHPSLASSRFVMGIDTPLKTNFRGRLRQSLGRLKLRRLLNRISGIIVAGERGFQYARFLGFSESQILRGVYGFDYPLFSPLHQRRLTENNNAWPKRFLFTGRYIPAKGIDTLLHAYKKYRDKFAGDAWPFTFCGTGPLANEIRAVKGIEDLGFVQPSDLPNLWSRCGVFVLPSRYEPWGVVVAEAAAAGLPILCTESVGSSPELVRSHFNGLTVATDNVDDLTRGLSFMHESYDQLPQMGQNGQPLAAAFSADVWAARWHETFKELAPLP